jgi:hypothetical protein
MRKFKMWLLDRLLKNLTSDTSGLVSHAEFELRKGLTADTDDPDRWMSDGTLSLIRLFSTQGHSGASAQCAIQWFQTLASYRPLGPLTGEDDEWMEVGTGTFQNKRCSRVFREDGEAYDSEGKVFEDTDGSRYTGYKSRTPVTFPYFPATEIVLTGVES